MAASHWRRHALPTHTHTQTHSFTHTLTHKPTHTHTLPHRHINIHNYNLISGHELQRRSLQTDQLTDRMVPLLTTHPPYDPLPPLCHCCSASVAVSFPAVGCLRVSVRLSLPVAHKLFAHPLIIFAHTHTHAQLLYTRSR